MKNFVTAVVVGVFAVSSAVAAPPAGSLKAAIEKEVKSKLRDPASARFEHLDFKGGDIYCGYVNSKNGFGGYAGRKMFAVMVLDKAQAIVSMLDIDSGDGVMETFCKKTETI